MKTSNVQKRFACTLQNVTLVNREREGPFVEMIKRVLIGGAILVALIAVLNSVKSFASNNQQDEAVLTHWQNTQTKP
jgi:hypothetical protein